MRRGSIAEDLPPAYPRSEAVMHWRLGGVGALLVAIALGACASTGVSERPSPASTLSWLRDELRKVRATPAEQSYTPEGWRGRDVSVLVGMKRGDIAGALGPPDVCGGPGGGSIPCYLKPDTVYVFF